MNSCTCEPQKNVGGCEICVECDHCGDTGLTTIYNYDGNGSDADDQQCPYCSMEREALREEAQKA